MQAAADLGWGWAGGVPAPVPLGTALEERAPVLSAWLQSLDRRNASSE